MKSLLKWILGIAAGVIAALILLPYWKVGGHYPYHDSLTLEVYAGNESAERLAAVAEDECSRLGAVVEEVIGAEQMPTRLGVREWVLRFFRQNRGP